MDWGFLFKEILPDRPEPAGDLGPWECADVVLIWRRWLGWLHNGLGWTVLVLGFLGTSTRSWLFIGPSFAVALLGIFLSYFLHKTTGRANTLRDAIAVFAARPDSSEPEGSRRLWLWEIAVWVLVAPSIVVLNIWPWLSLILLVAVGVFRYFIRSARREWKGRPGPFGRVASITYVLMLLVALTATLLRATGH